MSQKFLSLDELRQIGDPYAVLGISVAADDRRILKRYHQIAKLLHPDRYTATKNADKQLAIAMFTNLVNPAYEKLKQHHSRGETLALLRIRSRRIEFEGAASPQTASARELMQIPVKEADVFYEQAIATLAESQYQFLNSFEQTAQQLSELNLVYLRLKTGDLFVREKRTGIIAASDAKQIQFTSTQDPEAPAKNYAHSHYHRATEYIKQGNYSPAVQELRDAIKLEANSSKHHALLGYVYLKQNLLGMATVHIRQALKLNPAERLALKCAPLLNIQSGTPEEKQTVKTSDHSGLFGFLTGKKRPHKSVLKSK